MSNLDTHKSQNVQRYSSIQDYWMRDLSLDQASKELDLPSWEIEQVYKALGKWYNKHLLKSLKIASEADKDA